MVCRGAGLILAGIIDSCRVVVMGSVSFWMSSRSPGICYRRVRCSGFLPSIAIRCSLTQRSRFVLCLSSCPTFGV